MVPPQSGAPTFVSLKKTMAAPTYKVSPLYKFEMLRHWNQNLIQKFKIKIIVQASWFLHTVEFNLRKFLENSGSSYV